ncbi:MAG TPA: M23 family metallopeptidase, partial [Bryobacteraceae bacterium]|jgi:murein DD-endopeptidase MepM/ murein hydrolase activator NlpD
VKFILLIVVVLLVVVAPVTLFFLSSSTGIEITPKPAAIGESTPVHVVLSNPHGVRSVKAILEQDGKTYPLAGPQESSHRFRFFKNAKPMNVTLNVGKSNAPALHDGKAKLTIEAQSNDMRGETSRATIDLDVVTRPPHVVADGVQHYVNQAGCGLVVFTPSGYVTDSGVQVKDYVFRSFPLPKHEGERFSLFAYPWDLPVGIEPVVFAANPAGAKATAPFYVKLFPKKFKKSTIVLTDAFMQKVVSDIDPDNKIPGDLLTRFIYMNREMRKQNSKTLYDLRLKTEEAILWKGPFIRPKTKNEAFFADHRAYTYHDKVVDEETHLGFDLADRKHMPIVAPNSGKVIWADRLGIYGNCLVIDHGYGLQTIYGHMSKFDVKVGDRIEKGQQLGVSGETGMAGGDHLHFSMQVDGVQVNPIEWWDEHWIKDRVLSKME